MSRQRTQQRRVQRQAAQQKQERIAKQRRAARTDERRAARSTGRSSRGRTGWAGMRRSRRQRLGITAFAVVAAGLLWVFVEWQLALILTILLLLALPAFVVLTMGRRY